MHPWYCDARKRYSHSGGSTGGFRGDPDPDFVVHTHELWRAACLIHI